MLAGKSVEANDPVKAGMLETAATQEDAATGSPQPDLLIEVEEVFLMDDQDAVTAQTQREEKEAALACEKTDPFKVRSRMLSWCGVLTRCCRICLLRWGAKLFSRPHSTRVTVLGLAVVLMLEKWFWWEALMFWGLTCSSPINTNIIPVIHSMECLVLALSVFFSLISWLGAKDVKHISGRAASCMGTSLLISHQCQKIACSMLSVQDALTIILLTTAHTLLLCELFVTRIDRDARTGGWRTVICIVVKMNVNVQTASGERWAVSSEQWWDDCYDMGSTRESEDKRVAFARATRNHS
jgi:hypothetical protein